MIPLIAAILVMQANGVGLPLEEIAAYRDALRENDRSEPQNVAFADLWNRPDTHRGRRVSVRGLVVREFRSPASGDLPERVEIWIDTGKQNLICMVFPVADRTRPVTGRVQAWGRSLGRVRYQSGDSVRLAPLIVGSEPPRSLGGPIAPGSATPWDRSGWIVAALAAAVVAMFLARTVARRPPPARENLGPDVEFES